MGESGEYPDVGEVAVGGLDDVDVGLQPPPLDLLGDPVDDALEPVEGVVVVVHVEHVGLVFQGVLDAFVPALLYHI